MVSTFEIVVFNRAHTRRSRDRAALHFEDHDFLFAWAQRHLQDRLGDIRRDFKKVLQIGARTMPLTSAPTTIMDVSAKFLSRLRTQDSQSGRFVYTVQAEEEALPFAPQSFDLVTSALSLHTVNDLPGALMQIRHALKADGLFLACLIGGESLQELRASLMHGEMMIKDGLSPRVYPFADRQQVGALMQRAGFALPVVDCETVTVSYPDMFKLMRDLRGMGENNTIAARRVHNPGKALFMEAAKHYAAHFGEADGRIRATFEIIFMIGWAPHESQQKPLRPGSAQRRLADILGAEEIKAGDIASP